MTELTIILLGLMFALYILSLILKRREMDWIATIVSVCGLCAMLIDESLTDNEMIILIPVFVFVLFMSALRVMGLAEGR